MLSLVMIVWSKVKNSKIFWGLIFGTLLFGGGYGLGHNRKIPAQIIEHNIEDTVSKMKLEEAKKVVSTLQGQLEVAQTQITELKTHVKTVVHIVHQKDGTTVVDQTTESDTDRRTKDTTDLTKTTTNTVVVTDNKKIETDTKSHIDFMKSVTPVLKDKYYLGLSAGLSLKGITDPGLEFKYRVLDFGKLSIWSGVEAIAPIPDFRPQNIQGRLSFGVTF